MGISKYFTESIDIKRKVRAKVGGVMKETLTDVATAVKVGIDKATTSYAFSQDKETFNFTDVIFAPIGTDVLEDDIVYYDGREYDVISVINPMRRMHHLELLVNFIG